MNKNQQQKKDTKNINYKDDELDNIAWVDMVDPKENG